MGTFHIRGTPVKVTTVLGVLLLAAAAVSVVFFSAIIPAVLFLIAAVQCWSRPFEENRAKGKRTSSNKQRIVFGTIFAALGALFLWNPLGGMMVETPHARTFSASDAAPICEDAARDQITHPSTADFSILGVGFQSFDDGTSIFATTFTARNGFNLELEYQLVCDFTGSTLTDIKIVEAN